MRLHKIPNLYRDTALGPFTVNWTMATWTLLFEKVAVQDRCLVPSPHSGMRVTVEEVSQTPCPIQVCPITAVFVGWLHVRTGGCEGHVWLTEQVALITDPASTSVGAAVSRGRSGDAESRNQTESQAWFLIPGFTLINHLLPKRRTFTFTFRAISRRI